MAYPHTRGARVSVTGTGATFDEALVSAYASARNCIEETMVRLFGTVEKRGWYINGHAIVLEHRATRMYGRTVHSHDEEIPVVEVECNAEITVQVYAVTPTTKGPR